MQSKELDPRFSIIIAMVVYIGWCDSASINDTNVLLEDILNGYNKNVRPVVNQDDAVNVSTIFRLKSVQEVDEIRGIFALFGGMVITWHDAKITWDPQKYGGIEYVLTSYEDVWVPELILTSPADDLDSFGRKWQRVQFHHTGNAFWLTGGFIKSMCALNMKNYPFDTHVCTVSFYAWGYDGEHVQIKPASDEVDFFYYIGNSAWKITKTETSCKYDGTQVEFHFFLERKPGFVMINVVLPLTFLSLLNVFVFLLIPESGERISYCITVLLSIAVFMTIVSDTLPRSSEPVPAISYKLLFDMLISSLMTITTILNLRLYNKDDTTDVPMWLQKIYMCLRRGKSNVLADGNNDVWIREKALVSVTRKQSKLSTDTRMPSIIVINYEKIAPVPMENELSMIPTLAEEEFQEIQRHVSWKQISCMVDVIALVGFTFMSVCSLAVFIIMTYKA